MMSTMSKRSFSLDTSKLRQDIRLNDFSRCLGKIEQIVGMTVEAAGISGSIGDVCIISSKTGKKKVISEIVGFKAERFCLCPTPILTASVREVL